MGKGSRKDYHGLHKMRFPFGKKSPEEEKKEDVEKAKRELETRLRIEKRLKTIKKGEKNERLKDHEIPDLVQGLADGDG